MEGEGSTRKFKFPLPLPLQGAEGYRKEQTSGTTYAIFTSLNSTSGDVSGSRYISSISWDYIGTIKQYSTYLIATIRWSSIFHIVIYSFTTGSISYRQYSSGMIYGINSDPVFNR